MERDAAVAQGRAVFERYRSGARSSRTPATGCRTGAPATPATTRATPATALPGSGAAEGTAQSFLLRAVASTPAPTAAHNEEAAHRRELCDLLATQAALIDEASREARQLAAALDGAEAARCDSLLRLLAHQLSPLGARLVPQAKLVLAQLDSAAQREREAARQAELAEASVLRSDKKLELYRRQLIASASEHVAAAAAGQNGAHGAAVTDEQGRYIPGADERVERAHAERDELRHSLGAALTQMAAEREAAERRAALAEAALEADCAQGTPNPIPTPTPTP